MRFHTYSKFSPELADAVDLQSLLEKLADFLLQSGFAGGRMSHPYWGDFGGGWNAPGGTRNRIRASATAWTLADSAP